MNTSKTLPRSFYHRDTATVARELLGKILVRKIDGDILSGKIVETEAYLPYDDPAAHNFIGKTPRNNVLFGEAGLTYVHSIHRYHCIDITTEKFGIPGSVLIRALEPLSEIDKMKNFRKQDQLSKLTSGPGKLCQALDIKRENNGVDVTDPESEIVILDNGSDDHHITASVRIGISKAVDLPLRFYLTGNLYVSKIKKRF